MYTYTENCTTHRERGNRKCPAERGSSWHPNRPAASRISIHLTQQNKNFVALEEENSADRSYKAADVLLINQLYYFDKGFAIGRAVSRFLLFCLILMFFLYSPLGFLCFFKNGQKATLHFGLPML